MSRFARATGHRMAAIVVLPVVAALLLAGCTGAPEVENHSETASSVADSDAGADEWRRSIPMEPLTVPPEMVAGADRFDLGGMVGGSDDRPAMVAAVGTRPTGERYLQASLWDGSAFQIGTIDPGIPGTVQDVAVAGNVAVTALAGWNWEAGTISPFLLTSDDRRSWTRVSLPDRMAGYRLIDITADGNRVVGIAGNDDGNAAIVTVTKADSGEPTIAMLPDPPEGQHRSLGTIAVAGDTILVTGVQDDGPNDPVMAFRSTDAGRSWTGPVAIAADPKAGVWGIVSLDDGFLATGNEPVPDGPEGNYRAMAWFSADGVAWHTETLPEPDGFRRAEDTSALGTPAGAGSYALALGTSSSSQSARLFQRQPSGEWVALSETDRVADGAGRLGDVVPIVLPADTEAPAGLFVAVAGEHGMVVGEVRSGIWSTLIEPDTSVDPPYFSEPIHGAREWGAIVRKRNFDTFDAGGFQTWYEPRQIGLAGDALTVVPWDPPEADDWQDVERATDGDAEVVLASRLTENQAAQVIGGWFRPAPGQAWQPVTGFGAQPYEGLAEVTRIGNQWLAWGRRNDTVFGPDNQAMIWTSSDGVTWARAKGDFADGDRSSTIGRICGDAAGRPIAVGWLYLTEKTPSAVVWTEQDGRWQRTILPARAESRAWFDSCDTVSGQLVIGGNLDGDDQRWTIDAGGAFQPVTWPYVDAEITASPGNANPFQLDDIAPVSGGYVAVGRLDTAIHVGPVLWLSVDGSHWAWVPVPAQQSDASVLASVADSDLIVMAGSTNSSQAWRIPDIAAVIASIPAPT
jgi:hypothetical protein